MIQAQDSKSQLQLQVVNIYRFRPCLAYTVILKSIYLIVYLNFVTFKSVEKFRDHC